MRVGVLNVPWPNNSKPLEVEGYRKTHHNKTPLSSCSSVLNLFLFMFTHLSYDACTFFGTFHLLGTQLSPTFTRKPCTNLDFAGQVASITAEIPRTQILFLQSKQMRMQTDRCCLFKKRFQTLISLKDLNDSMSINILGILTITFAWCANGQTVHKILSSGYSKGFYNLTFNGDTGKNFIFATACWLC